MTLRVAQQNNLCTYELFISQFDDTLVKILVVVAFTTELFKALCSVSVDCSILTVGPQKNPWLLIGVAVPFMLNLVIIYTPIFSDSFGLVALNEQDWLHVLLWSFPIVLIDELQKVIYRQGNTTNY